MKFRVWDTEKQKFFSPTQTQRVLIDHEGRPYIHVKLPTSDRVFSCEHLEIDRWTGLKDMHGKEIYENDIVIWGHHCLRCREDPIRIAVVKMDPDIQFHEVRMDSIFRYGCFAYRDTSHLEVIGNAREHPQALSSPDEFLDEVFKPLDITQRRCMG